MKSRDLTADELRELAKLQRAVARRQAALDELYDTRAELWATLLDSDVSPGSIGRAVGLSRMAVVQQVDGWRKRRSEARAG